MAEVCECCFSVSVVARECSSATMTALLVHADATLTACNTCNPTNEITPTHTYTHQHKYTWKNPVPDSITYIFHNVFN